MKERKPVMSFLVVTISNKNYERGIFKEIKEIKETKEILKSQL